MPSPATPTYSVTGGSIIFNGEDITELPVNERAKKGIFLSFQNPLEVPGVTLSAFIRSALEQKTGRPPAPVGLQEKARARPWRC